MPLPLSESVSRSLSPGDSLPLVSCILPVTASTQFLKAAIRDFQHQTYRNRELVVVGERPNDAGRDTDARVRWVNAPDDETEREKIVRGVQAARGSVIAHWSDDWNGPERLTQQVADLRTHGAKLTGLTRLRYIDPIYSEAWDYAYGGTKPWLAHPTWAYQRAVADLEIARPNSPGFIRHLRRKQIHDAGSASWFVARMPHDHDRETRIRSDWWQTSDRSAAAHPFQGFRDDPRFGVLTLPSHGDAGAAHAAGRSSGAQPLVSCLMPTGGRERFARQAVRYFQRQTYPNRELIVVDDGDVGDTAEGWPLWMDALDPCETDAPVRYLRVPTGTTIGAKRNAAVRAARGDLLLCWDDDDWYGPERIGRQVEPMIAGRAGVTALGRSLFYHVESDQFWRCSAEIHARMFYQSVIGGTLAFRRSDWRASGGFPAKSMAEDASFLRRLLMRNVALEQVSSENLFVYVRHGSNSWRFATGQHLGQSGWSNVPRPSAMTFEDLTFYQSLSVPQ